MVEKATGLILLLDKFRTQGFNISKVRISKSTLTPQTMLYMITPKISFDHHNFNFYFYNFSIKFNRLFSLKKKIDR